ncbi:hypothetical protein MUK42_01890 [Musa troglodytarum]|uniref:Transmembrane protein n=1 Tax=Musa troglodytarum TaxID=320322 RepID=A0A9E7FCH5_9LILI|nr:hypothetical protein MUK42_01890 [Musa troglodytarum]
MLPFVEYVLGYESPSHQLELTGGCGDDRKQPPPLRSRCRTLIPTPFLQYCTSLSSLSLPLPGNKIWEKCKKPSLYCRDCFCRKMGIITSSFPFLLGVGCGVYIAQNYEVPNMKKLVSTWILRAKGMEETYRKPKKDED